MIEIKNLTKKFGQKIALDDVNLTLQPGICGLLGSNGAGKTTLMRCLLGLLPYQRGQIRVNGHLLKCGHQLPSVGYLPQRFQLYRELTVQDMLRYFANLKEIPRRDQDQAIRECLETVNLTDQKDAVCRSLSGGMVRRLGIAQALLGHPDILVFDEPTAGLDPEERIRLKLILNRLSKTRTTILSTHIVDDVDGLCDYLAILDHGQTLKYGTTAEIAASATGKVWEVPAYLTDQLPSDVFVVRSFIRDNQPCLRILAGTDLSVSLQAAKARLPTVEDGFMVLVKQIGMEKAVEVCCGK